MKENSLLENNGSNIFSESSSIHGLSATGWAWGARFSDFDLDGNIAKAGVIHFTKSIARAYGKKNIMAFLVAPGFTRTDMAQDFIDLYGEDHALHDIALQRLTEPEDIAPLIVLLASGLADHATGTSIDINAGSYVH